MAPKRANPIDVPPAVSSDDEEDEVISSGEEEEEDDEEGSSSEGEEEEEEPQTPLTQKNPPPKYPETSTPSAANQDSEESESDFDSESDTPKPNAKLISMKPMKVKALSSKRPTESLQQEDKEAKRPKKKSTEEEGSSVKKPAGGGEDAKKNIFQRLFSEEDEIALLKGMLDYSAKKGTDPIADMNAFFEFVKKSIHTDVTKAKVMDKIRRLKKKFENNACKGKEGEDPNFSKAHEIHAFKLSKKIWGKEGISGKVESSAAKLNGKAKGNSKAIIALKASESVSSTNKKVVDGRVKVDGGMTVIPMEVDNKKGFNSSGSLFDKRFGVGSLKEEILKHGFDMVDAEKKANLEAIRRNLQIRELELFVERNEIVTDLAKSMLESYKSKGI